VGTVLGSIGNALACGGSTTGAHIHFTRWSLPSTASAARVDSAGHLRPRARSGSWNGVSYEQLSGQVAAVYGSPVDGEVLGGWRFTEGADQYSGTATRMRATLVTKLPGRFRYEG
jgi:LasA protease